MDRTLVIGDCHIDPSQDLSRFDTLGRMIVEEKPTAIIQIGDFLNLDSLSHWDKRKSSLMEGRRLRSDLDAGREAMDRMMLPLTKYNEARKRQKKGLYKPVKHLTWGNHDWRLPLYYESNNVMNGLVDMGKEIGLKEYGWGETAYKEAFEYQDILFTHVPVNDSGKGYSTKTAEQMIGAASRRHVVFGHRHGWTNLSVGKILDMGNVQVLCVGCFFEHTVEYALGTAHKSNYWKGVAMLNHLPSGKFDAEQVSLERMRLMYGS